MVPRYCADEAETRELASELARRLAPGDVVLLSGPLGAGKTTFVRGVLESLGFHGPVRSPTFNLLQVFETKPPVLHVDLYRVNSAAGLGIEDYLETHICLIEWPDRVAGLVHPEEGYRVKIEFAGEGRVLSILEPRMEPN